jgi:hypothetical protein
LIPPLYHQFSRHKEMEEKIIKEHKDTLKEVMEQIASVSRFIKGVPADTPK